LIVAVHSKMPDSLSNYPISEMGFFFSFPPIQRLSARFPFTWRVWSRLVPWPVLDRGVLFWVVGSWSDCSW
jgi:hypothetical protein